MRSLLQRMRYAVDLESLENGIATARIGPVPLKGRVEPVTTKPDLFG